MHVTAVGVRGHCANVKIGNAERWPRQQVEPVRSTGHQSSRTQGESESGMFAVPYVLSATE